MITWNMPSMITVFFPSRGRPESVKKTISGLRWQANRALNVRYIVAHDPDDTATRAAAAWAGAVPWQAPERYGYSRQQEYYNQMLPSTSGSWLMLWGDDAMMQTTGWDALIRQQQPAVLWPQSNGYPYCFPIVPAAWARELGRFSPSAHPDSYWYSVGKGLDRHVELHEIAIYHDRKDLTGGHDDQTYAEGRGLLGQTGMADDGGAELVAKDVEVLRRLL